MNRQVQHTKFAGCNSETHTTIKALQTLMLKNLYQGVQDLFNKTTLGITSFQIEVLALFQQLTANRPRHASGPVLYQFESIT